MSYDYFVRTYGRMGNDLRDKKISYETMACSDEHFENALNHIGGNVSYVVVDNILVNRTIHKQYLYNVDNAKTLINTFTKNIEDLEKTLTDLKAAKQVILEDVEKNCKDTKIKRDILIENLIYED